MFLWYLDLTDGSWRWVGSFVVANAFVSRQARTITSLKWGGCTSICKPINLAGVCSICCYHWCILSAVSILSTMINIHPQHCGVLGDSVIIGLPGVFEKWQRISSAKIKMDFLLYLDSVCPLHCQGTGVCILLASNSEIIYFLSHATRQGNWWAMISVWFLSLLFWSFTIILDNHIERVSR